ncbi:hypothetical protein L0128_01670 [candidate division KSB1 bacterium]|nr:hypothetical protein [candidate division KSB1 bacterium]
MTAIGGASKFNLYYTHDPPGMIQIDRDLICGRGNLDQFRGPTLSGGEGRAVTRFYVMNYFEGRYEFIIFEFDVISNLMNLQSRELGGAISHVS